MKQKKSYSELLQDPRWQRKRLEILDRDNYTCLDCGASDRQLHVHHCFYERGNPWDTGSEFLLTLCGNCHEDRQSLEADLKRAIGIICAEMDKDNIKNLTTTAVQTVTKIQNFRETKDYERGLFAASVWDEGEVEFLSDIRWWNEAYENKKSRICYENVTGRKPKWPKK